MSTLHHFLQSPLAEVLGWTLLHFIWQGVLIGLVGWLALRITGRAAPNIRYAIACALMLTCVAAPVATFLILVQPPEKIPAPSAASLAQAHELLQHPVVHLFVVKDAPALPVPNTRLDAWNAAVGKTAHPTLYTFIRGAVRWAVPLWLLGIVVLQLRLCLGWCRIQLWRRGGAPVVDPEILAVFTRLAGGFRRGGSVRLLLCKAVPGPLTLGWLKPVILLPAQLLTGLSRGEMEAVIAHELAHIRRYDYLANLLQSAIEAVLFYHPVVWWLGGRIREIREECCDEEAVRVCPSRMAYAKALMAVAELQFNSELALAATGGDLLSRISRLLGRPKTAPAAGGRNAAWTLVLAGAVIAMLCLLHASRTMADNAPAPANATPVPLPVPTPTPVKYGFQRGPEPGRVFGEIVDENGNPVSAADVLKVVIHSAKITVTPGGSTGWAMDDDTKLTEENRFRGDDSIQGGATITVGVLVAGHAPAFSKPLTDKEAENIHIVVTKGFAAAVDVVDESGKPVEGAKVTGSYNGPPRLGEISALTDAKGEASIAPASADEVTLSVEAKGFTTWQSANVHFDPHAPVHCVLKKAQPVTGRVLDENGSPVAGAVIKLGGAAGPLSESHAPDAAPLLTKTDGQGQFTLEALNADADYHFYVEQGSHRAIVGKDAHTDDRMEIKFDKPCLVAGKVISSGAQNGAIKILLTQYLAVQKGGFYCTTVVLKTTLENGVAKFRFENLYPAHTEVSVYSGDTDEHPKNYLVPGMPVPNAAPMNGPLIIATGTPEDVVIDLDAKPPAPTH